MRKNRFVVFDLLKIIFAFTIVNFHLESFVLGQPFSLFYYLGWYGVPIFIVISFYFNSKYFIADKLSAAILVKKVNRLLFPLLFWSVIGFLTRPVFITPKYILRQVLFGTAVDPPLYYLNVVIIFTIIWFLIGSLKVSMRKWILGVIIFISLVLETSGGYGRFISFIPIQSQFFASRFLELLKFASFGSLMPDIRDFIRKFRFRRTVSFLLIPVILLLPVVEVWSKWQNQITQLGYAGLFQYAVIIIISIAAVYFQNISLGGFLDKLIIRLGKYVIGIYCIHYFFIENIKFSAYFIQTEIKSFPLLAVFLIVSLCLVISYLMDKVSSGKLAGSVS